MLAKTESLDKRKRDASGRYPRLDRPTFEQIISSFGDSWSSWCTLAIAIRGDSSNNDDRSSINDDRSSSFEQQEGGATPLAPEAGTPRTGH